MADTYLSLRLHLVWATKNRRPWLDPEWRPRLFACASNIISRKEGKLLCAGGVRDHLHLYLEPPGTVTIAELVSTIKANTYPLDPSRPSPTGVISGGNTGTGHSR